MSVARVEDPSVEALKVRDLDVDRHRGLTRQQVELSLRTYGSNRFTPTPKRPLILQYLDKFKDPTIIVLGIAAIVSIALGIIEGHYLEGIGIVAAIFVATGVGFYSEYKSNNEFELLANVNERIPVKVTRDGEFQVLTIDDVVTGDLVHLETGDKVPADLLVVQAVDLSVNESLMTGESRPVSKDAVDDRALLRGTTVEEGSGTAVTQFVGDATKLGQIKDALVEEARPTPLQEKLDDLAGKIGQVGTLAALLIFAALLGVALIAGQVPTATGILLGLALASVAVGVFFIGIIGTRGLIASIVLAAVLAAIAIASGQILPEHVTLLLGFFLVAVTVVVVAVPEGLPLAVTVTLAFSMRKIAKDGNLVRKLAATETIGSANVIASDKTGTLTQNRMTMQQAFVGGKAYAGAELAALRSHPLFELLTLSGTVNSTAHLQTSGGRVTFVGNSTEGAILAWLEGDGVSYEQLRERYPALQRRSFSADRKRMTSAVAHDGELLVLTKGAPERVIPLCTTIETADGPRPLAQGLEPVQRWIDALAEEGMRTLAFAYRRLPASSDEEDLEKDLTLLAVVGIADPVREDVAEAIRVCEEAGIDVKMVTGDHQKTAASIARQIGLLRDGGKVLSGEEFRALSDEERVTVVPSLRVISRAEPLDKLKLVEALQARNDVVAVTGDGTNDAPALKRADVGISMGKSGTDVAKEASDIVLLEDDFGSIVRAVRWGRALFENIQKFIQFQLTVNVSALAIAFLGALFGFGLPLTVIQLLWVNLIMDTLAAIALGLEPPTPGLMKRKPKRREDPIITGLMWWNIMSVGIFFVVVILALLQFNFLGGTTELERLTIVFATFVFFQLFNLINSRSIDVHRSGLAGITESPAFLGIWAAIAVVTIVIVQIGGEVFRTTPLSVETWVKIIAFTAIALIYGELSRFVRARMAPRVQEPLAVAA